MTDRTPELLAILGKVKPDDPAGGVELYLNNAEFHRVCELLRNGKSARRGRPRGGQCSAQCPSPLVAGPIHYCVLEAGHNGMHKTSEGTSFQFAATTRKD